MLILTTITKMRLHLQIKTQTNVYNQSKKSLISTKPLKKTTPHSFKGQQLQHKQLYRFVIQMSCLDKFLSFNLTLSLYQGTLDWLRFTMICPKTYNLKSCTFKIPRKIDPPPCGQWLDWRVDISITQGPKTGLFEVGSLHYASTHSYIYGPCA